ncbi:hypothetical protein GCM10009665_25890 [Kitasatospora nipponensis]|uniref:S1 motif domain-containing protein n=1 Tax=Kitasatospora nipponensis TaxID=258049 RepID=A0ABN1W620_9ACTN
MRPTVHRITPYDPARRGGRSRLLDDFDDFDDFDAAEEACRQAVAAFARDDAVQWLTIDNPMLHGFAHFHPHPGPDDHGLAGLFPPGRQGYHDGARVPLGVALGLVATMLRLRGAWCRLHAEGGFFVHVGHELDVYVGSARPCEDALARTRALGLIVERIEASPYDPAADEVDVARPADRSFWTELADLVAARGGVLLEELPLRNASRWHRLTTVADVETVRTGMGPRARLAVWPDLTPDTGGSRAALSRPGRLELLVVQQPGGEFFSRIAEPWMIEPDAGGRTWYRGDLVTLVPLLPADRDPLLAAVLPDDDGVVRARWRNDSTRADDRRAYLHTLRRGEIVSGVVSATPTFGVFVDFDDDLGRAAGFINIPELSWTHIDAVSDVVTVGQEVRVEVLAVDLEREQVALSLRSARGEDPWRLWADTVLVGQVVPATVTALVPFGAFVRVAEGIEGLVHLTELAPHEVAAAEEVVQVGDEVHVLLLGVDLERRRISVSIRQADELFGPNPADAEFHPARYGLSDEHDDTGAYVHPAGYDPQREAWERRYAEAESRFEAHRRHVIRARAR